MALEVDGFEVLRSIGDHPSAFSAIPAEAAKAARDLVLKQIKSKASDLTNLRAVQRALGRETVCLILDGVPDSQIKTLLTRLDKNHPELKESDSQWRRRQLIALLDGSAEPTLKQAGSGKPRKAKKKPAEQQRPPELLDFKSAGATRKR
jgi:hypothetical protein